MAREVGIVIKAKDLATKTLQSTGGAVKQLAKNAEGAFKALLRADFGAAAKHITGKFTTEFAKAAKAKREHEKRMAQESRENWGKIAGALSPVGAALKLVTGAFAAVGAAIAGSIAKSLALRSEHDKSKKTLTDLGKSVGNVVGSIGDKFIPILVGAAEAFKPIVAAVQKWLDENDKLIKSSLIEWAAKVAHVLVDGVASAVLGVYEAWLGWKSVILVVEYAWHKAVESMAKGLASLMGGVAEFALDNPKLANTLLGEGGAQALQRSAMNVRALGHEHHYAAEATRENARVMVEGYDELKANIDEAKKKTHAFVEDAKKNAEKASTYKKRTVTGDEAAAHAKEEDKKLAAEQEKLQASWAAMREDGDKKLAAYREDRYSYLIELDKKAQEAEKQVKEEQKKAEEQAKKERELNRKRTAAYREAFSEIGSIVTNAFSGIDGQTKKWGDAWLSLLGGIVGKALDVLGKIAESAAFGSDKEEGGAPTGGLVGILAGKATKALGFADGGHVTGGAPGKDSVPALLMGGEYVATREEVAETKRGNPAKMLARITGQRPRAYAKGGYVVSKGVQTMQNLPLIGGSPNQNIKGGIEDIASLDPKRMVASGVKFAKALVGAVPQVVDYYMQEKKVKRETAKLTGDLAAHPKVIAYAQQEGLPMAKPTDTHQAVALAELAAGLKDRRARDMKAQFYYALEDHAADSSEDAPLAGLWGTRNRAIAAKDALAKSAGGHFDKLWSEPRTIPQAFGGYRVPNNGRAGLDSVMIAARPGERMLSPSETRRYENSSSGGATVQAGPDVNVTVQSFGDAAAVRRMIRDSIEPHMARNARLGVKAPGTQSRTNR